MSPEECVRKLAGPIGKHGGAWMFDAEVHARGKELGLEVWSWYHCGRGGVLGQPDPAVVVAAFGFFPPHLQTKAWNKGIAVLPAPEIASHYADACAEWGRRTFASVADAGRLADLLAKALDGAGAAAGMPLFAGWRAKLHAGPADPPARLALALQAGRELRGSAHLVAVAASGLTPLEAVMSGRTGAVNAEFFGWPQPWPDPEANKAAMAEVEAHTDRILVPVYATLTEDERAELVAGLRAL